MIQESAYSGDEKSRPHSSNVALDKFYSFNQVKKTVLRERVRFRRIFLGNDSLPLNLIYIRLRSLRGGEG